MATTVQVRTVSGIRRWWPAAAGVALAGFAGLDIAEDGGVGLAPVLAASAVIYLGAAALGRPGASWMERLPTEKALTEQTRAFKTRLAR